MPSIKAEVTEAAPEAINAYSDGSLKNVKGYFWGVGGAGVWNQGGEEIEVIGVVSQVLPGTMFRVKLENDHEVLAHIAGKMRKRRWIRLAVGDKVKMEMSPYDLNKARIIWRLNS